MKNYHLQFCSFLICPEKKNMIHGERNAGVVLYWMYMIKQNLQVFYTATVPKHCPREKAEIQAVHKHS